MKKQTLLLGGKIFALMALVVLSFSACSDDDEDAKPAYVGSWYTTDINYAVTSSVVYDGPEQRILLVLNTNDYTMTHEVKYIGTTDWRGSWGGKGSIGVAGDVFTTRNLKDGEGLYDGQTFLLTGEMTWTDVAPEDQFDTKMKWSVSGNTLTLTIDDNEDGVFDVSEQQTFTRL